MDRRETFLSNLQAVLAEKGLLCETSAETATAVMRAWEQAFFLPYLDVPPPPFKQTVHRWLCGETVPRGRALDNLAAFLDCDVTDLMPSAAAAE